MGLCPALANTAIAVEQAAHEYPARQELHSQPVDDSHVFLDWLVDALGCPDAHIDRLAQSLVAGNYRQALETMIECDWALSAAACELVEIALQGQLTRLADSRLAMHCGINWTPDYTSWLFDTANIQLKPGS